MSSYADAVEFNTSVLQSMGLENIDLSAFNGDNEQFAGKYLADIELNEQNLYYNHPIHFYIKDNESRVCFTSELLSDLPLSSELRSGVQKEPSHTTDIGNCYAFEEYDPAILVEYDEEKQKLKLRIPHAYVVDFDSYWIPPSQRDYGISGLILDYNLLQTFSHSKNNGYSYSNNRFSSYGVMGFNIGRFRFRTNYQYDPNATKKFERTQTYAFTDIGSLNAQLYVGELRSSTNLFESVQFKGATLFTDENMMPNYLQGYAPQISGTANSTAIVTVRQYSNIIKQIQVPPGPFTIRNLPSYISGIVTVTVEESDGQTHEFEVELSSVPFLTRPGAFRYNVNIGELDSRYGRNKVRDKFITTDGSYGLSNTISVNGGINYTFNRDYQAYSLGLGLNLNFLGALSFDITRSENKVDPNKNLSGQSYRFNYAKRFNQNTSLNLVGYRFSSREYTTLNNYVDMKSHDYEQLQLEKNRLSLSVSQYIPDLDLSVTATGSKSTYWNQKSNSYYNISFSKTINKGLFERTRVTFNLGHNRSRDYKNNTVGLYVNIPLGNDAGNISYNNSYNGGSETISQQLTYYNKGLGGNYSVGVSMNNKRDFSGSVDYALNANYNTNLAYGNFNSNVSYSDHQQFASASFNGSLTLTQHGLATHPYVFDDSSRLIVDTDVSGVGFIGNSAKSNIFGLAGIANIPDYTKQTYLIDNDNLPNNVDIPDNVLETTSTKGAIIYRDTHAIGGEKALVRIILPNGEHPPFGATIYRENGADTEVGMIADNGLTYLAGLNNKSTFIVKWGLDQSCKLQITSTDLADLSDVMCQ
ncbi:fimbrial outer membrane usher protein StdB [Ignatzschineria ureiclastica]|uniref:fimbria/pilus outer membrane usher protein n=1 Tax=Ignatzschineria ureiclastica TaxID=472582 RepID=UPI00167B938D|nr:fimbria/pilus outer membrane usher protein [Ignatzschineria ureiclastica]GGZ96403.1 fimbrial outer membrane usher protein StdB [Ignatzschineria ureiclastica]